MTSGLPAQGIATGPPSHRTFGLLVQDDTDLVGHVAYALYKRDKIKFCDAELRRTGQPVTSDAVDTFIRACNLDTRISSYRSEAERLLEQMTEYVLEDAIETVKRESQDELVKKLAQGKSWLRAIAENVVGSIAVALIWATIVFVVATNKVGADKVLGDVFDKDVADRKPAAASSPAK